MTSEEIEPAMTWQLTLAAQQADAVLAYFIQQLTGDGSDKLKVLASQYKHLSVTVEMDSKLPVGLLFYKQARIVAPVAIRKKLIKDAHRSSC